MTSALVQDETEQCLEYALAAGWVDARGKPLVGTASGTSAIRSWLSLALVLPALG